MSIYEVNKGDSLYQIVKNEFGLKNKTDIMNKVNSIIKDNGIKNANLIRPGQKLNLGEELSLKSVTVEHLESGKTEVLKDKTGNTNYYRAGSVFGDIASKPQEYNQPFVESELNKITQATPEVEKVVVNIQGYFTTKTARDAQAYDIAAKPSGVGGFKDMKDSDAYKLFLEVNADDFELLETEYNHKKEVKAYLDNKKSDGKVTVFSSEIINNKEYLAMRDKDGVIHYFDKENGLNEVKLENE